MASRLELVGASLVALAMSIAVLGVVFLHARWMCRKKGIKQNRGYF